MYEVRETHILRTMKGETLQSINGRLKSFGRRDEAEWWLRRHMERLMLEAEGEKRILGINELMNTIEYRSPYNANHVISLHAFVYNIEAVS